LSKFESGGAPARRHSFQNFEFGRMRPISTTRTQQTGRSTPIADLIDKIERKKRTTYCVSDVDGRVAAAKRIGQAGALDTLVDTLQEQSLLRLYAYTLRLGYTKRSTVKRRHVVKVRAGKVRRVLIEQIRVVVGPHVRQIGLTLRRQSTGSNTVDAVVKQLPELLGVVCSRRSTLRADHCDHFY
jgi:hypothetical protein